MEAKSVRLLVAPTPAAVNTESRAQLTLVAFNQLVQDEVSRRIRKQLAGGRKCGVSARQRYARPSEDVISGSLSLSFSHQWL